MNALATGTEVMAPIDCYSTTLSQCFNEISFLSTSICIDGLYNTHTLTAQPGRID